MFNVPKYNWNLLLGIMVLVVDYRGTKVHETKYITDNGLHIVARKESAQYYTLHGVTINPVLRSSASSARGVSSPWKVRCLRSRGRNFRPGSDYSRRGTINSQFENPNRANPAALRYRRWQRRGGCFVGDTVAALCNPVDRRKGRGS